MKTMRAASRLLLPAAFVLLQAPPADAQPFQWWRMESVRTELGLSAEQSATIERLFQEAIARMRVQKDELDRREGNLSQLIQTMAAEGDVVDQIDRVEAARAALNKTRTLMLLHMRQALTAEQLTRLNAMHERWQLEQRNRDRARSAPGADRRPGGSGADAPGNNDEERRRPN